MKLTTVSLIGTIANFDVPLVFDTFRRRSESTETMRISTLVIIAIWLLVVGGNVISIFAGSGDVLQETPPLPWIIVLMPLVVIFGAYRAKGVPGEAALLSRVVDGRVGPGAYRNFINALRPELMFSAMCFGIVVSSVARQAILDIPSLPSPILGFFAGGGVAFLIAYYIRKSRSTS